MNTKNFVLGGFQYPDMVPLNTVEAQSWEYLPDTSTVRIILSRGLVLNYIDVGDYEADRTGCYFFYRHLSGTKMLLWVEEA